MLISYQHLSLYGPRHWFNLDRKEGDSSMVDTSIIERKIHGQVMDMCLEAIVSEAFISSLPIPQNELTDGLTQHFAQYASECLKDLGGAELMKQAMENNMGVAQKAYIRKMWDICNETATSVTARILEENKNDDTGLKEAAQKVSLTPAEYKRFSNAAASLAPDSLAKIIQKKTLDTIKEEQEAYRKDAELETELVNALNVVKDDGLDPDSDVPPAMQGTGEDKTGAEIGQGNDDQVAQPIPDETAPEEVPAEPLTESYGIPMNDTVAKMRAIAGIAMESHWTDTQNAANGENAPTGINIGTSAHPMPPAPKKSKAQESHFVDVQNASKKDPAQNITGAQIGQACPCPVHQKEESSKDPVKKATDKKPGSQIGQQGAFAEAAKGTPDMKKVMESYDAYMKSIAGPRYRTQHSSVFSKLQELAYESVLYTRESYDDIPFETMTALTKENTFTKFHSNGTHDLGRAMESVSRYDFAQEGILDRWKKNSANKAKLKEMADKDLISIYFDALRARGLEIESDLNLLKKQMAASEHAEPDIEREYTTINGGAVVIEHTPEFGMTIVFISKSKNRFKTESLNRKGIEHVAREYLNKQPDEEPAQEGVIGVVKTAFRTATNYKPSAEALEEAKNLSRDEKIGLAIRSINWTTAGRGTIVDDDSKLKALKRVLEENFDAKLAIKKVGNTNYLEATNDFKVDTDRMINIEGFNIPGCDDEVHKGDIFFIREKIGNRKDTLVYYQEDGQDLTREAAVSIDLAKKGKVANESEATPDVPEGSVAAPLNTSLLVASIIYTFFETLKTMNLYCPKLDEIRNFVDENLPIKDRVEVDRGIFIHMIKKALADTMVKMRTTNAMPEVEVAQKDLDIVRERIAAPGFESVRKEVEEAVESLQTLIDQRRDYLVSKQRPQTAAVESAFQTMKRTRDVLKFDRTNSLMARKPNVSTMKFKVDPQGNSKYIAVEAYNPDGRIAGKSTIVLEGDSGDLLGLVDYVESAMKSSKLMDSGKRIMLTDSRSGKVYMDENT